MQLLCPGFLETGWSVLITLYLDLDPSRRRLLPLCRRGGDGLVSAGYRCPNASVSLDQFSIPVPMRIAPFNYFLNLFLRSFFSRLSQVDKMTLKYTRIAISSLEHALRLASSRMC